MSNPLMTIHPDTWNDGNAIIALSPDAFDSNRNDLEQFGYRWTWDDVLRLRCWQKSASLLKSEQMAASDAIRLGIPMDRIDSQLSPVTVCEALRRARERSLTEQRIRSIATPARPACFPPGRWNGKVYGGRGGYHVYVDNQRIPIRDDDYPAVKRYETLIRRYRNAIDVLRSG